MRRTFTVTGDAKQAQELFAPTLAESSQEGEKTVITEIAFYNAPEELWKLSCNLAGEGAEYTLPEIQVDAIADKEFEVNTAKGETAKVILTPYAAWIQSNGAWMQKEDAYQFAAVFADGEEEEIAVLPVSRSKKAREKELQELPFLERDTGSDRNFWMKMEKRQAENLFSGKRKLWMQWTACVFMNRQV